MKINAEQIKLLADILKREITRQEIEQLQNFIDLFDIYNSHTNLVSKRDAGFLFEKHVCDSLALAKFFQKFGIKSTASLLDIGTGGGFPSIPISLFFSEMKVYPIDSIAKKIGFIELVQKELRLDNITPVCRRVEDFADVALESFDVVTSRAVASLNTLLEYSLPFVKVGSYFVAFKSKGAEQEIEQAQNAIKILNCEIVDRIGYNLPCDECFSRELIVFRKNKKTPHLYPRKLGLAKKNPL